MQWKQNGKKQFHTTECHIYEIEGVYPFPRFHRPSHTPSETMKSSILATLSVLQQFFFAILVATTTIKTTPYLIRSDNREMECMQWRYSLVFSFHLFFILFLWISKLSKGLDAGWIKHPYTWTQPYWVLCACIYV